MQPGYNKRAALPQIKHIVRALTRDTRLWHDTVWIADSTTVPCGMSRLTVKRSELAGYANLGGSQDAIHAQVVEYCCQRRYPGFEVAGGG